MSRPRTHPRSCLVALIGVSAMLAMSLPAQASAANTLSASFSDTQAGTVAAPAPVTASTALSVSPVFPGSSGELSSIKLDFGPGFSLGGAAADQTCSEAQVQTDDSLCPLGSEVGTGTLTFEVLGLSQQLQLTAFNAPNGSLYVLADGSSLLYIHVVLESTVSAGAVTISVPSDLSQPAPGAYISLSSFDLTLGRGAGASASWTRTTGCSTPWTTTATVAAADASNTSAQTTTPCTQGAGGGGTLAPVAQTGGALQGTDELELLGTVDRMGSPTFYTFEWGLTTAYDHQTPLDLVRAGSGAQAVSTFLANPNDGQTYHYRVVASNAGGTSYGNDATFTAAGTPSDLIAPRIDITTPAPDQHFAQGAVVNSSFSCDDGSGSGVADCSGPAQLDTSSPGGKVFTVQADDVAGNHSTKSVAYVVDAPSPPGGTDSGGTSQTGGTTTTPGGTTAPPPPPDNGHPAAPGIAKLGSASARVKHGTAALKLRCDATAACTGNAVLRIAAKGRTVVLGRFAFSIEPGSARTVRVRLSKRGRALLKRHHRRLKATLLLTPTGANAPAPPVSLSLRGR